MKRIVTYKRLIAIMALTLTVLGGHAQSVLSERHRTKIENEQSPYKKLQLYKKFHKKDSLRKVRAQLKSIDEQMDSLSNTIQEREQVIRARAGKTKDGVNSKVYRTVYKPWAIRQSFRQVRWLETQNIYVSLRLRKGLLNYWRDYFITATQDDSTLAELQRSVPGIKMPKQLNKKVKEYTIMEKSGMQHRLKKTLPADSRFKKAIAGQEKFKQVGSQVTTISNSENLLASAGDIAQKQALDQLSGLKGMTELNGANQATASVVNFASLYKAQAENLQDSAYLKEQARQKAEALAMDYIKQNSQLLQPIQKKTDLLMKRYSVVANTSDLGSGTVKANSMAGAKFKERLYFASNFQVLSVDPFAIDFSPMIGYRLNRKFVVGAGINLRKTFADTIPAMAPDVFGYKAFASYDLIKDFFAYSEYNRNTTGIETTESGAIRHWHDAAFVGAGRKVKVHPKIEMTFTVMYNLLYDYPDPVYPKRWSFRIGFQNPISALSGKRPSIK